MFARNLISLQEAGRSSVPVGLEGKKIPDQCIASQGAGDLPSPDLRWLVRLLLNPPPPTGANKIVQVCSRMIWRQKASLQVSRV